MNSQNNDKNKNNFDEVSVTEQLEKKYEKKEMIYKPNKKKLSKKKKVAIWVPSVFLSVTAILVVVAIVLVNMGKSALLNTESMNVSFSETVSDVTTDNDGMQITHKGVKYRYNKNMTAILCMGVDRENFADESVMIGTSGQADALFLFCIDTKTGESTVIPIPRDTMAEIDIYSGSGNYTSSDKQQICLAYAYGDGKHTSCKNTVKAVSRLFYGVPVNSYVAIDLKAVEVLTDKLGGVNVIPTKNYNLHSYSYTAGKEYTLYGKNARSYVQERDKSQLNSSLERMERQKQFLQGFFKKALQKTKKNISTPLTLYNSASEYMVTDIGAADISFLTSCMLSGSMNMQFASFTGEMKMGEKYAEYYVDEQSVYDTVLKVFYEPV